MKRPCNNLAPWENQKPETRVFLLISSISDKKTSSSEKSERAGTYLPLSELKYSLDLCLKRWEVAAEGVGAQNLFLSPVGRTSAPVFPVSPYFLHAQKENQRQLQSMKIQIWEQTVRRPERDSKSSRMTPIRFGNNSTETDQLGSSMNSDSAQKVTVSPLMQTVIVFIWYILLSHLNWILTQHLRKQHARLLYDLVAHWPTLLETHQSKF